MARITESTQDAPQLEKTAAAEQPLQVEIARRNFVRAAMLAQQFHYPRDQIRHLQELALRQMACEYRNAIGTRNLAKEWGFSRADLESLFMKTLEEYEARTDKTRSDQCYDGATGEYLTLRQWIEKFLKST